MEQKISCYIARRLKAYGAAQSEAILSFGCELILTSIVGVLLMVVTAIIMNHPIAWMPFLLGFAPLRTTAGGFHAKKHITCYLISTLVFMFCLHIAIVCTMPIPFLLLLSVASFVITFIFSPVVADNKPLTEKKKLANRKVSLMISGSYVLITALICCVWDSNFAISLFCFGEFAAVLSLLAASTIRKFSGKEEEQ